MDQIKIPVTILKLAKRYGFVVMEEVEFDNHLSITSAIMGAAFRMYDALEQIATLGGGETSAVAAAIARDTQADIDQRMWQTETPER